jgi:hypothetical protein
MTRSADGWLRWLQPIRRHRSVSKVPDNVAQKVSVVSPGLAAAFVANPSVMVLRLFGRQAFSRRTLPMVRRPKES